MKKMKTFIKIIFTLPAIIGIYFCTNLTAGYGTTGAQILNLNSSPKITAMGNANAGLSDDLNAVIYNPAGLTNLRGTAIQFTRLIYFLDTSMNSLTFGCKLGSIGTAFKWKLFKAADIYRDSLGYNEKNFEIKYTQYTMGFACPVIHRHSMGVSVNIITQFYGLGNIAEFGKDKNSLTAGFNAGWIYREHNGDSFGFVIKNMGNSELPLKYIFGNAHHIGRISIIWEIFTGRQINFGCKCGFQADLKGIKVRCGFNYITNPDISFGFGLPLKNLSLDYAFSPHRELGIAHRLSLGVNFK